MGADAVSDGPKRREPPLAVKLATALIQLEAAYRRLGDIPADIVKVDWQFDHHPPLGIRPINADRTDWEPPQHDPTKLSWLWKQAHFEKTYGTNKATAVGSDRHMIDHTRRVQKDHEEFRKRLLSKEAGQPREKTGSIKGRGFQRRLKEPKRSKIELQRMNGKHR